MQELHAHVEKGLEQNLQVRCSNACRTIVEGAQHSMAGNVITDLDLLSPISSTYDTDMQYHDLACSRSVIVFAVQNQVDA